jgi:hypothetical protein
MNHEYEKRLYGRKDIDRRLMPKYGTPLIEICSVEDLKAFVQVGKEMKIDVTVLNQAGEEYYNEDIIEINEGPGEFPAGASINISPVCILPEGKARIGIANEIKKMFEFYTKVDAFGKQAEDQVGK